MLKRGGFCWLSSGGPMDAFLVSLTTVGIAEMGDRTQILSLLLAARFRKPWPIIAAILVATLANHALAGWAGVLVSSYLTPRVLDALVGGSLLGMAIWTLIPDKLDGDMDTRGRGAFIATLIAFFIAEMGDKTQIATATLAAGYMDLIPVLLGSTAGLMLANVPVVFLGDRFAARLPLKALNIGAAFLFAVLGIWFLTRSMM